MRFGYDGSGFSGWARQPAGRTVEGVLRDGLRTRGITSSAGAAQLEVASRTDRGVSARANALALRSELSADSLLDRLNAIAPEVFFTAAAQVPTGFRVRHAERRIYRYFDPGPALRPQGWPEAAALFAGPVDVRSFGRGIPGGSPQRRLVEAVTVRSISGGRVIEVRAPSFVWGMVRKIVGALREVDAGRLTLPRLQRAIDGAERLTLPLAEPGGLVLWDVEFASLRWTDRWQGPNRHQATCARRLRQGLWTRAWVAAALGDVVSGRASSSADPFPPLELLD